MADNLTPEQRTKNMKNIRAKDTVIEKKLRKALWKRGYRYKKNVKELPGKPDIVIEKYKIAIFCDSEFFHGKDWNDLAKKIDQSNNRHYWHDKILRNIIRDNEITATLRGDGWTVLRFWGREILKNTEECVRTVEEAVFESKMRSQ